MAIVGSAIGAVGSIIGGKQQAKAADKAAQAQVEAARIATEEQKRQFDAIMKRTEPQYQLGLSALGKQAFYAGVGAPTGFANKLEEIGAPRYPTIDPMTGKIKYTSTLGGGKGQVAPPSTTNNDWLSQYNVPPSSFFGNNLPGQTNQQWLEEYMKRVDRDTSRANNEWLTGSG